ncbi:MAG: ribonuclease HI [Spirochaetaceae bacterium]|jgi:ribonuclease HI|nr:ribonuclease HI [Spirochaetaceae bacterium]
MALHIYTDGGCSGNPGPGGWAYVILKVEPRGDTILAEESGFEEDTTNNRMELLGVISALKALKSLDASGAVVHTDSQYVQKGITGWIHSWKKNSWRTGDKRPVKNQDLWKALDLLAGELTLDWKWVRGHEGNRYNELCDKMARNMIKRSAAPGPRSAGPA